MPTRPRNSAVSGQLEANPRLIRLAVSLIRTAIFSNRSRMVENSPLASGREIADLSASWCRDLRRCGSRRDFASPELRWDRPHPLATFPASTG